VNFIKRHTKPSQKQRQGGIIEREGPIHLSNVQLYCKKCAKPVRLRHLAGADGEKSRPAPAAATYSRRNSKTGRERLRGE